MNALHLRGIFTARQFRRGRLLYEVDFPNALVTTGANQMLDTFFRGVSSNTWYIGLIGTISLLRQQDTMSSHSGWTEATNYLESARPVWLSDAAASSRVITNSNNAPPYTFPSGGSIVGAFLVNSNVKGGTAGTLFCTASMTSMTLASGDILTMTYRISVA